MQVASTSQAATEAQMHRTAQLHDGSSIITSWPGLIPLYRRLTFVLCG